ncbi:hypothetical protein ACF1G0_01200 [Streptomyces sp. NPDC013953]
MDNGLRDERRLAGSGRLRASGFYEECAPPACHPVSSPQRAPRAP